MQAVAVFQGKLKGSYVSFYQDGPKLPVKINIHVKNLMPGKHGFHIHEKGNLMKSDCSECAGHWNPYNKEHGGLNDINFGFEPDFVMIKSLNGSSTGHWHILDQLRGITKSLTNILTFESNSFENKFSQPIEIQPKGLRFTVTSTAINGSGTNYAYMAIRRGPMKVPTSGTDVLSSITLSNNGAWSAVNTGFPPDMIYWDRRNNNVNTFKNRIVDKVRGLVTSNSSPQVYMPSIFTHSANGESASDSDADYLRNQLLEGPYPSYYGHFPNNGFRTGSAGLAIDPTNIIHSFRRSSGFFDIVLYYGNSTSGRQIEHNLQSTPELIIVKNITQNGTSGRVYCPVSLNDAGLTLDSTGVAYNPSSFVYDADDSTFTVGADVDVNGVTTSRYIAYLFGSVSGVSKIGSYKGDNTNGRIIDCGFTNGARLVISKCTSNTQDWYLWDSERGFNTGDDPRLRLDSNQYEATDTDSIDSHPSGFIVNSDGNFLNGPNYNYIFLAIA